MRIHRCLFGVVCLFAMSVGIASAADFTVEKTDNGVTVKLDGKLFTEYLIQSGKKPVLWPIIGPTGKPMTRPWPMDTSEVDKLKASKGGKLAKNDPLSDDHPWHRSLWFSYQSVNGSNLWEEHANTGSTKHREFVTVSGGPQAKIVTRNDWLDPAGKKILEDERTITCSTDGDNRMIDFDIALKATEGDVTFGDEKDGVFGVRVPDSMRVDAKQGGSFVNSDGKVDEPGVWGKPASWVDYHGPVDGETLGIAIMNHPSSYLYPTYWHTRDYGLFAANPFARHAFDANVPKASYQLASGETKKFRFRLVFHKGDEKEGHIAEAFAKYSQQP
jgi:Methane oxygenase PmoA